MANGSHPDVITGIQWSVLSQMDVSTLRSKRNQLEGSLRRANNTLANFDETM